MNTTTSVPACKRGPGYNQSLPSKLPFMWIEHEQAFEFKTAGRIRIIAFGAYNALGLIGPEKGGVAVVHEDPNFVIATKDFPYDPAGRLREYSKLVLALQETDDLPASAIVSLLRARDYISRA